MCTLFWCRKWWACLISPQNTTSGLFLQNTALLQSQFYWLATPPWHLRTRLIHLCTYSWSWGSLNWFEHEILRDKWATGLQYALGRMFKEITCGVTHRRPPVRFVLASHWEERVEVSPLSLQVSAHCHRGAAAHAHACRRLFCHTGQGRQNDCSRRPTCSSISSLNRAIFSPSSGWLKM